MVKYLNEAKKWFQSKGIDTDNTRFAIITNYVELLAIEFEKYKAGQPHNFLALGNDIENSVYEAEAFILIYRFLNHVQSRQFDKLLKIIVKGPDYSVNEDPATNLHRNHLFELYLAAKLTEKGMTIKHYEDIVFDFDNFEFAIQCKRPFNINSLSKNINYAYNQLKRHNRLESEQRVRGIIALSVDKILGFDKFLDDKGDFKIPKYEDRHAVMKFITDSMDSMFNQYRTTWSHLLNSKVLAIFFFFRFPVIIISENNLLTNIGYVVVTPLINKEIESLRSEYDLLIKLHGDLE